MSQYREDVNTRYLRNIEEQIDEFDDACIGTLEGIERLVGVAQFNKIENLLHGLMRVSYQRGKTVGKLEMMANQRCEK